MENADRKRKFLRPRIDAKERLVGRPNGIWRETVVSEGGRRGDAEDDDEEDEQAGDDEERTRTRTRRKRAQTTPAWKTEAEGDVQRTQARGQKARRTKTTGTLCSWARKP